MRKNKRKFAFLIFAYVIQQLTHLYTLDYNLDNIINDLDDILLFIFILGVLYILLYRGKNWARVLIVLYNGVVIISMFNSFFYQRGLLGISIASVNGVITLAAILILSSRSVLDGFRRQ